MLILVHLMYTYEHVSLKVALKHLYGVEAFLLVITGSEIMCKSEVLKHSRLVFATNIFLCCIPIHISWGGGGGFSELIVRELVYTMALRIGVRT